MTINTVMNAIAKKTAVVTLGAILLGAGSASPALAKSKGHDKNHGEHSSKHDRKVEQVAQVIGLIARFVGKKGDRQPKPSPLRPRPTPPSKGTGKPDKNNNGAEKGLLEHESILVQQKQ